MIKSVFAAPIRAFRGRTAVLLVTMLIGIGGSAVGVIDASPAGAAGPATQLAYTTNPSTVAAGAVMTAPVVQLRDATNNNVTQSGVTVTLAIASGPGTFYPSATTTEVTNGSGQAIFSNLVFDTVGSYTLTASSSGLTSKTSPSFSVTPGPLSQMTLSNVPTTVVSGAALGITATLQDADGNTETGISSGSITLSVATGPNGGALAGTVTRTPSSGVTTFSAASLTLVGSYTITATDSSGPTATTGSIVVTPGAAKKLIFVQGPSNTMAGSVMSPAPTVQVADTNGNAVADSGVTVTILSTGSLTSGSTKAVATDSNGLASFSNLTWNTAGTYTLAASASGLTATGNSSSFTISAGSPTNLVFTTQPAAASAGSVMSTVVVKIEDSLGNVETGCLTTSPLPPMDREPSTPRRPRRLPRSTVLPRSPTSSLTNRGAIPSRLHLPMAPLGPAIRSPSAR